MQTLKKHCKVALTYFSLIAILGVVLRLFPVISISTNYKYLVHTHSHIALLGWVYTALTAIIYYLFLKKVKIDKKYRYIFWLTQLTIIGMLVSFPFTGYAFFSILFSTLFLIASYLFAWLVMKFTPKKVKKRNSYKLIRVSLWYMIISSIGPWLLGIIMQTAGSTSSMYKNAIYFYLHFQYNGWFIVAIIGIFLFIIEKHTEIFSKKEFKNFYWFLNSGVIATFLISIFWMKPPIYINLLAGIGGVFQLIAFYLLLRNILQNHQILKSIITNNVFFLLKFVCALFLIKLIVQIVVCLPILADTISSNVDFVIAYIHYVFLGVVSISILTIMLLLKSISSSKLLLIGYIVLFVLTEVLISYKGFVVWNKWSLIPNFYIYLAIASGLFTIIISGLLCYQFKLRKN